MISRREFLVTSGVAVLGQRPRRRTRVALVGTGIRGVNLWGKELRQNYSDVVEFVGLSDINPGRLEFAKTYDPDGPDPYRQRAGIREGAMAALVGVAARKSANSGSPVRIADLTTLVPGGS